MTKKSALIGIVILGYLLSGCGSAKSGARLPYKKLKKFETHYYEGAKQKVLNNKEQAIENFQAALDLDPNCHECMYQLGSLYFRDKKYSESLEFSEKAVKLSAYNHWYSGQLAQVYYSVGKFEESAKTFERMIAEEPKAGNLYMEAVNQYLNANNPKKALQLLDQLESELGVSESSATRKEFIYMKLDKTDLAVQAIQDLVDAYPDQHEFKGYLAESLMSVGRNEEAIAALEELSALDSSFGRTEMLLYELYTKKGELLKGYLHLKKAFYASDIEVSDKLKSFSPYYLGMRADPIIKFQAMELSDILMEVYSDFDIPYIVKGDIYNQLDSLEISRSFFERAVEINGADHLTWNKLISIDSKMGNIQLQLQDAEKAIARFPNFAGFHLARAYALLELGRYEECLKACDDGLDIAVDRLDRLELLSCKASVYNEQQRYDLVDEYFEEALLEDPTSALVLNNYAYSLAERGVKLEYALELIVKAIEGDPGNPYYKDTKAWILFKLGNSSEAIRLLKEAISIDPLGMEYHEHLAEIYKSLGKDDLAERSLNRARQLGSTLELKDIITP